MQKVIFLLVLYFFTHNLFAKEEYFLTLRNETVNLRQGPSFDYPVKIFYKKKFLPVLIQDKSDTFRKIRDHENNSGWIHISQLSKKKAATRGPSRGYDPSLSPRPASREVVGEGFAVWHTCRCSRFMTRGTF